MPSFYVDDVDVDIDEFLSACSKREIEEVINYLVDDGHLPKSVVKSLDLNSKGGKLSFEFSDKIENLKEKYYSISKEDEEILETIFNKYL